MAISHHSVTALEDLQEAVREGKPFGYKPYGEELWIGEGPDHPDRVTYSLHVEDLESAIQAVVGVHKIRQAFK